MQTRLSQTAVTALLGATSLFSALEIASLEELARCSVQRVLERNQYLWWEGDAGEHLCVIASGQIKLITTTARGDDLILAVVGSGDVIGELAVLDEASRSASAVAVERSSVVLVRRASLLAVMSAHPAVANEVLRALARLVRTSNERTVDQVYLDVGGRLAKILLRLATSREPDGSGFVDLGLTQSDLAALVGATRPAVNRALQSLAARNMIILKGHSVAIRDLEALRRRSMR